MGIHMGRKPARALLILAAFALLAGLSIAEYMSRHGIAPSTSEMKHSYVALFLASFRYYLAWAIVAPGIVWLSRRVPLATVRWRRALAFHLMIPILGSVPFLVLAIVIAAAAGQGLPPLDYLRAHWWRIALMLVAAVLPVYWLILGAATALLMYREREASQLHAIELQRSLEAAELAALQMKLHPHFLFNALNTVACLALAGDTEGVGQVIDHLGALLRRSMETSGRQLVTIDEELALLDEHLAIEEIRFKDHLHVVRRIDAASRNALVPNLILEPLVENALAHGVSRRLGAGLLEISVQRNGSYLNIAVRDDGPGLPPGWGLATHAKQGLKNVMQRLQALYAASFGFEIVNTAAGGAVAELRLPFRELG